MSEIILAEGEREESLMLVDLKIIQNDKLYKFTSDSVVLSRFAPKGKKRVLDLCSGSGIVGLHYYGVNLINPPEKVDLCEIQPSLAEMSRKSVMLNGLEKVFTVYEMPLQNFCGTGYDLVTVNPPYKKAGSGFMPENEHLAVCRAEKAVTLKEIILAAKRALKDGGSFCMCHRAERLAEIIFEEQSAGFGVSRITPLCNKKGDKPYLVLVEGLKNRRPQTDLTLPLKNDATTFAG